MDFENEWKLGDDDCLQSDLENIANFCMWVLPTADPLQQLSWTRLPTTLQTSSNTVDS